MEAGEYLSLEARRRNKHEDEMFVIKRRIQVRLKTLIALPTKCS
jgi:hypothetical protein